MKTEFSKYDLDALKKIYERAYSTTDVLLHLNSSDLVQVCSVYTRHLLELRKLIAEWGDIKESNQSVLDDIEKKLDKVSS